MKKLTIALIAILSLSACDKLPGGNSSRSTFVKMCKEDPNAKAQEFDCNCQADILTAVLKQEEMTKLIDFIGIEKQDKNKAMELGKDPVYAPIFQKIAGVGYAIMINAAKPVQLRRRKPRHNRLNKASRQPSLQISSRLLLLAARQRNSFKLQAI